MSPISACFILVAGLSLSPIAFAERADRDQPVNLEADRVAVDDAKKILTFEGNVVLTQGSLSIRSQKLVVIQDDKGYQKGVATGTPARFRQKREGREDFIEGEAERIEHDARTERTEFFGKARVKSGGDEVTGQFISFDSISERYVVTGAPPTSADPANANETGSRVRATLQPKNRASGDTKE